MNIFKIEYDWYDGDHSEILIGKDVNQSQFEIDILKAKVFAESLMGKEIKERDYLGKGYRVDCFPEYYEQIVWFLTSKLGYIECGYDSNILYNVEAFSNTKIGIIKSEKKVNRSTLELQHLKN